MCLAYCISKQMRPVIWQLFIVAKLGHDSLDDVRPKDAPTLKESLTLRRMKLRLRKSPSAVNRPLLALLERIFCVGTGTFG